MKINFNIENINKDNFDLIILLMLHDACHDFDNSKSNKPFKDLFINNKLSGGGKSKPSGKRDKKTSKLNVKNENKKHKKTEKRKKITKSSQKIKKIQEEYSKSILDGEELIKEEDKVSYLLNIEFNFIVDGEFSEFIKNQINDYGYENTKYILSYLDKYGMYDDYLAGYKTIKNLYEKYVNNKELSDNISEINGDSSV